MCTKFVKNNICYRDVLSLNIFKEQPYKSIIIYALVFVKSSVLSSWLIDWKIVFQKHFPEEECNKIRLVQYGSE